MSRSRTSGARIRCSGPQRGARDDRPRTRRLSAIDGPAPRSPGLDGLVSAAAYLLSFALMLAPWHHPQSAAPRALASRGVVSTHPPMEQRISALQRIELALQVSSAPAT